MNEKDIRAKAKSLYGKGSIMPPCWSDRTGWGEKPEFEKWCDEAEPNIVADWLKELGEKA